jgi:serine/threonine-protein kinase HipA
MAKEKHINELVIFRDKIKAGTLKRTENGCEFEFDKNFINNQSYSGISFSLPKTLNSIKCRGVNLPPFFAGLLPEGLRLKAISTRLKTSEDDLFSMLAAIGSHVIGDVYVEPNEQHS